MSCFPKVLSSYESRFSSTDQKVKHIQIWIQNKWSQGTFKARNSMNMWIWLTLVIYSLQHKLSHLKNEGILNDVIKTLSNHWLKTCRPTDAKSLCVLVAQSCIWLSVAFIDQSLQAHLSMEFSGGIDRLPSSLKRGSSDPDWPLSLIYSIGRWGSFLLLYHLIQCNLISEGRKWWYQEVSRQNPEQTARKKIKKVQLFHGEAIRSDKWRQKRKMEDDIIFIGNLPPTANTLSLIAGALILPALCCRLIWCERSGNWLELRERMRL